MEPRRLVGETGRFDALLLRSGLEDEPDPDALRRAEAALGLCVGVGLGSAGAAASKLGAAKLGAAPSVTKVGTFAIAKWLGTGLVGGVLVTSAVRYGVEFAFRDTPAPVSASSVAQRVPPAEATPPEAPTAETKPHRASAAAQGTASPTRAQVAVGTAGTRRSARRVTGPASEPQETPVETEQAPSSVDLPDITAARKQVAASSVDLPDVTPTQEEQTGASLASEVALLARARRALFAGRADASLKALETYEKDPGNAVLRSEAELLRIEALVRKGNLAAARALAKRSLEREPNGPHARRLREIALSPTPP